MDLSQARHSSHGLYWYNLHVVFRTDGSWAEIREDQLAAIRDMLLRCSRSKGYLLSRAGILADHIHLTLGCQIDESPADVALAYMNNLAFLYDMKPVYRFSYYVGTFGEYDLGVMRQ